MPLIAIIGRCATTADSLARIVAERLGYRFIPFDALVEKAVALGLPGRTANNNYESGILSPLRARRDHRAEAAALRAALADEATNADVVLSGWQSFLLPRNNISITRILVTIPTHRRVTNLMRTLQCTEVDARRHAQQADEVHRQRVRRTCGSQNDEDSELYDMVLAVEGDEIEEACATIVAFVLRQYSGKAPIECRTAMAEFALASRIEAVLAIIPQTAHLDVTIRTDRGLVFLAAKRWDPRHRALVCGIISLIPGARRIELVELGPPKSPLRRRIAIPKLLRSRQWVLRAAALGLIAAGGVCVKYSEPRAVHSASVTGIITDTHCAAHHPVITDLETTRCVRECVDGQIHAKYALFDGARTYRLGGIPLEDRFTARIVTIDGRLDGNAELLQVRSIRLSTDSTLPGLGRSQ